MKLVITIDDDIYDDYLKQGATLPKYGTAINNLYEALWNGVPLPEPFDLDGLDSKVIDLAIKALEQQPCKDCVSREAIKEKKAYSEERHEYVVPVAEIDWLPSVQPQSLEQIKWERDTAIEQLKLLGYGLGEKVEHCEDWYDVPSDEMTLEQARQAVKDLRKKLAEYLWQEPCEDCISREAVEKITWEKPSYDDALNVLTEVRDKVRALPSVKPQRPQGKWIEQNDTSKHHFGWYYCSNCGAYLMSADGANYCSCCGSLNGGKTDGNE